MSPEIRALLAALAALEAALARRPVEAPPPQTLRAVARVVVSIDGEEA